jgi:DNA-binding Lrp family transcriptional regulator
MDDIDTTIITRLQQNGRTPYLDIARKLKLSEGAVRKRVAKLMDDGTIKRFTIDVNHGAHAIMGITLGPRVECKKVVGQLKAIGATAISEVTGRYDIIIDLYSQSMNDLNTIIDEIRALEGVSHTETFTVLKDN